MQAGDDPGEGRGIRRIGRRAKKQSRSCPGETGKNDLRECPARWKAARQGEWNAKSEGRAARAGERVKKMGVAGKEWRGAGPT